MRNSVTRRLPVGAELVPGGVHFRVWAPEHKRVEVVMSLRPDEPLVLERETTGYFSGLAARAGAGARYAYRLDEDCALRADPASRFQPEGPHGLSEVVDPSAFAWTDSEWRGLELPGLVLYELHVGTFTPEGTWTAASRELEALAKLGVTAVQVMPVADFSGDFGWGYDGVNFFAPTRLYGSPDDMQRFVDTAHRLGLGVILDVVYNHAGPDGCYLPLFSRHYFTSKYPSEWGQALNFDGPESGPVREFFIANAGYWISEFHLDGLRLDATQCIFDDSKDHILAAIQRHVRESAKGRGTILIAENEPQHTKLVRPIAEGGYGLDAMYNDDLHHAARVAATGHNEAYYSNHRGSPQEFISAAKHGFLYQGQLYAWQKNRRGTSTRGLDPAVFLGFLQNHDQVANSGRGERLHQLTSPGRYRALTALALLGPWTPLLFQGQEFYASAPFLYFADHTGELARAVQAGRSTFLRQFPSIDTAEAQEGLAPPASRKTFEACKLDLAERVAHQTALLLHQDLLTLRRSDPVIRKQGSEGLDGAVLSPEAFVLRFFDSSERDRILIVNLGTGIRLSVAPEPLLAPPEGHHWTEIWSSEHPRYGGAGTPTVERQSGFVIPAHGAVLLGPRVGRSFEDD